MGHSGGWPWGRDSWPDACLANSIVWKLLADILEYHRALISDTARCNAFHQAISACVKPGDVVLDIGTGSGLLAMFACQAGARHVYALEEGMIADLAEQLIEANQMRDRITLIRARSSQVDLPEKVDVVVSETIWNFGLGEGILATLSDAKTRLLKPGGRVVPEKLSLQLAPVRAPERYGELAAWNNQVCGIDMSRAYKMAKSNMYRTVLHPDMLVAGSKTLCELELGKSLDWVHGRVNFVVHEPAIIHGLGGWFDATLCEGLHLHNAPPSPAPSWKNAFMPLPEPVAVQAGDWLMAEVDCVGDESAWRWAIKHVNQRMPSLIPRVYAQSTLGGFPSALERLAAP